VSTRWPRSHWPAAIWPRGERKRPTTGWEALTPSERDVVGLVKEGLGNQDIAARLFISSRTVQTHPTYIYAKLGITSRPTRAGSHAAYLIAALGMNAA